jgi:hypothetical protein
MLIPLPLCHQPNLSSRPRSSSVPAHDNRYDDDRRRDEPGRDERRHDDWRRDDRCRDDRRSDDRRRDEPHRDDRRHDEPRHDEPSRDESRRRDGGGKARPDRAHTPFVDVRCQICKIYGHPGDRGNKVAHAAAYGIDTNWYTHTGATDHITGALNKLTTHDKYQGRDRVHTADDNGMKINHIGRSILHTPNSSLHLKNILHVPSASKNLLSVHKITLDNHVFIEYYFFF